MVCLLGDTLALLVLLGNVRDGKTCLLSAPIYSLVLLLLLAVSGGFSNKSGEIAHTRGKRLLELLGLVLVLEDEGVKVAVAADLELDLLGAGLLDAGSCEFIQKSVFQFLDCETLAPCGNRKEKRTGSVLAAADLNELLDVENLGRHDGRCVVWLN